MNRNQIVIDSKSNRISYAIYAIPAYAIPADAISAYVIRQSVTQSGRQECRQGGRQEDK